MDSEEIRAYLLSEGHDLTKLHSALSKRVKELEGEVQARVNYCPINASFLEAVLTSYRCGVNEVGAAADCIDNGDAVRASFEAKAEAALSAHDWERERDVSLWLTDDEATLIGIASMNCQSGMLTDGQFKRLERWYEAWREKQPKTDDWDPWNPPVEEDVREERWRG